jgi:hypothetical protein
MSVASARRQPFDPAAFLALLLLANVCGFIYYTALQKPGIDFYHYWFTARALREQWFDNVYSSAGRAALGERSYRSAKDPQTPERERHAAEDIYRIVNSMQRTPTFATIEPNGTPFCYACFDLATTGNYEGDYRRFNWLRLACAVFGTIFLC